MLTGNHDVPRKSLLSRRFVRRLAGPRSVAATLAALAVWPAGTAASRPDSSASARALSAPENRAAPAVPSPAQLRSAARFAATRGGVVAYAVVDSRGRMHSRNATRTFPSASLGKTLLLAATLRRYARAEVPPEVRARLGPMIRESDNAAAYAVYRGLGDPPLRAVARAAGLRHTTFNGTWSNIRLTAPDVARLFLRMERLVPARHRRYAMALLGGVVPSQSWGIPHALRPRGWSVRFKGGWRRDLVHQGALAERNGRRVALAILTSGNPPHDDAHARGRATLQASHVGC